MTDLSEKQETLPKDWMAHPFPKTIIKNGVGRGHQIKKSEIQKIGAFPVIDQGQAFIAGYTDKEEKLLNPKRPLVVFGDHTRCFKYVDFPFVIGADGTKILFPNEELVHPKFFYFYLLHLDIPNRGYNRHFRLLQEKVIACPPRPEQVKIAETLSLIQNAIKNQEQIIQTTTELKKALMQKLFTEGLHGEKQNQTEIGPMPESWQIVKVNELAKVTSGGTPRRNRPEYFRGDKLWVKSGELEDNIISDTEEKITSEALESSSAKMFPPRTVLIAMYGATVGKTGILGREATTNQAVCALLPDNSYDSEYLRHYFIFIREKLLRLRYGGAQPNISQTIIKNTLVPLPQIEEQEEIGNTLTLLNRKMWFQLKRNRVLRCIFQTMLHQLMTGQIRVKDLNVEPQPEAVTA